MNHSMKQVKVNRVVTPDLAQELELLGADLVGVELIHDPRFADHRHVETHMAASIARALKQAIVVAHVPSNADPDAIIRDLDRAGIRHVELSAHPQPAPGLCARLRREGIGIGYCRLVASHDDDPTWILSGIGELDIAPIERLEIELLPEIEGAWNFFRDRPVEYEEDLHLSDIDAMAAHRPLFISMAATAATIHEVVAGLPSVAGLTFNLGVPNPGNYVAHGQPLEEVKEALRALRGYSASADRGL